MAIKKDRKGLVDIKSLTNEERPTFIKFLKFERERHEQDIEDIDNTIAKLRIK